MKGYPAVQQSRPKIWPSVISAILLLFGLARPVAAQSYTIMPTPFQAPLNDTGSIVVGGCVWTYAAGTTTPISTYTNTSGTTNTNPIIIDSTGRYTAYLLSGTNYKFVYETACTPPAHGTVLRTADNIAGTPSSSATVDVTGTAGETISAGQCAYLSDGSGSKIAGQYYKCDSANTYSSSAAIIVGLAPSAITSSTTGTIRIAGSVTGLTALTPGLDYYAGSAGALTATQPTNARAIGSADSATSLVVKGNPGFPNVNNGIDCFRLTLTTGVPVTTADVTGASAVTIFAAPMGCNRISLFDSLGNATTYTSAQFSIAVPATTSQMYDVFAFSSSGVPTLELLAWTNDTTRATAIVQTTTGSYTKSGDLTRRYLGSFRTTTVSGQTEDSAVKRYLWNYYNRDRRPLLKQEATATWTYTTATLRQANAAAANQVDMVIGVAEATLHLTVLGLATNSAGNANIVNSIGEDSTTTTVAGMVAGTGVVITAATYVNTTGMLVKKPAVGRHFYAWLEYSTAVGTTTWTGAAVLGVGGALGLTGYIEG